MLRHASVGAAALCALAPIAAAQLEEPQLAPDTAVRLSQTFMAYNVTGKSVRELRASIAVGGPRAPDGARFGGFTTWNLNWSYPASEQRTGGCVPVSVTVYLDLTVQYPAWKDSTSAPGAVRDAWNRYHAVLMAHETNHVMIAVKGANWLATELKNLRAPRCLDLQERAQAVAVEAARRIREENDLYDKRTRHGAAEGGVLVLR
jgi:predicted secreted Zn-dependent protease